MDTAATAGPLDGLRVIEFEGIGPVPHCAMLLANLGADIVTIRRPGGTIAPPNPALDRGRHVIEIDLAGDDGKALALAACSSADVLLEGFRPGVMERLGLGPETLTAANPRLIYARLTGWGQGGDRATSAGHDINYLAASGALAAFGEPGMPPRPPLNLLGDYGGGSLYAALGILAALHERGRSGRGQVIDAAIVDGVTSMMALFTASRAIPVARERSLLGGAAPFYRCYACADGRYVAVGALEEKFWVALLAGLGLSAAAFGPRHDPALWPAQCRQLEGIFATRGAAQWAAAYAGTDACVTLVEEIGDTPVEVPVAPRLSRTPGGARAPADDGRAVIERWATAPR